MSKFNPKVDLVFKKLFGSEENKDILQSLINAILPPTQQIKNLVLKNPYNISDYAEGKLSILDIKAEDEAGILYDIEMQMRGSEFYGRRALYYWAKMYGSQLDYVEEQPTEIEEMAIINPPSDEKNKIGYAELKKCIVINVLDFDFFEDERYHRYYTLKDGDTNETHKDLDYLDLYFIELVKQKKGKAKQEKNILERWMLFLNNSDVLSKDNLPKELAEIEAIKKASVKLEIMYLNKKEMEYYEAQQKFWLDEATRWWSLLNKVETMEKSAKETEAKIVAMQAEAEKIQAEKERIQAEAEKIQAEAEKLKQQNKLMILNLIKSGLSDEALTQMTGVSLTEIEALRNT